MPVKKATSVKRATRGPAAAVSRRASSIAVAPAATRRDPSAASPLASGKGGLSIPVYSLAGRAAGTYVLPKEIFGAKINKSLLSQAMRVYMTNQKTLPGFTKTRGEVEGSTAKIYRQKGTGRARHGSIRAPIFVGGGIVFGPKPRKLRLELPQRMKKAALISALSAKAKEKQILGISGIEKASGKTKEMAELMYQVSSIMYQGKDKKKTEIASALIVIPEKMDNVAKGTRNIPGVDTMQVSQINAYEVLRHGTLILTKDAVEKLGEGRTVNKKEVKLKL